jgi:prepilin-type N-terminal cleavage/methylation domain-containing protein
MHTASKCKAFTLIELIIVIILTGILTGYSVSLFAQGLKSYFAAKDIQNAYQAGFSVLARMSRDIRGLGSTAKINTATSSGTRLVFTDVSGNTITFVLNGTGQIVRTLNATPAVLGDNIKSLTFTYYDINNNVITPTTGTVRFIKITLQLTVEYSYLTISTTISTWNF